MASFGVRAMKSKSLILVACGMFLFVFLGAVTGETRFPFTGQVTRNNVYIRSGPDINYYPVAKLMRDNKVQVLGEEDSWYKIDPPSGTFSVVHKDFVEKSGSKGIVNGDRVAIRAWSSIRPDQPPHSVQMLVGKGTEVEIVGEYGNWYKITPPAGAFVWISKQYVKPVGETGAGAKTETPAAEAQTTQPAAETAKSEAPAPEETPAATEVPKSGKIVKANKIDKSLAEVTTKATSPLEAPGTVKVTRRSVTTQPFYTETETTVISTKTGGDVFGKYTRQLIDLDQQFIAEFKKPLKDRNFDKLIAAYTAIAEQKENKAASIHAKGRLDVINFQKEGEAGYKELTEIQQKYAEEINRVKVPTMKDYKESEISATPFQGSGILRPSLIFNGPLMPERFRLFDPVKCRTIAYVEVAKDVQINLSEYIGKHVAVYGTSAFDAKLGFPVIQASMFKIVPESEKIVNSPSVIP